MLKFDELVKSSKAYNIVSLDAGLKKISHAYLFVSQDENYLLNFCENISMLLLNLNEKQFVEKNNARIRKHIHPDVKFYGLEKNIDPDTVDKMIDLAGYTPFESDKKIFVLWNVHQMSEAAQNKILKIIEEPPKNTYFLLASQTTSKLLPTILSRVKEIALDELEIGQITQLLVESGVQKNKAEVCAASACGNASFAEKIATSDGFIDLYNQIVSAFFEINGSKDVLKFASVFSAKNVDKTEFLNIFEMIARDIGMILSKNEQLVINKNVIPKLKVVSSMLSFDAVSELVDECLKQKQNLVFNVNANSAVDGVLFKLAEVKVKCRRS